MQIIVEHDGSADTGPKYYKYCDGKPIFGAKKEAARVEGAMAEMVLRQLHQRK